MSFRQDGLVTERDGMRNDWNSASVRTASVRRCLPRSGMVVRGPTVPSPVSRMRIAAAFFVAIVGAATVFSGAAIGDVIAGKRLVCKTGGDQQWKCRVQSVSEIARSDGRRLVFRVDMGHLDGLRRFVEDERLDFRIQHRMDQDLTRALGDDETGLVIYSIVRQAVAILKPEDLELLLRVPARVAKLTPVLKEEILGTVSDR